MNRRDEQVGKSWVVREFLKTFNWHHLLRDQLEISCKDPNKKEEKKRQKKKARDVGSEALI
jgi:hypothetical protein